MNRLQAAIGSTAWLLAAPGVVCGVVPWLITGWRRPEQTSLAVDALAIAMVGVGTAVLVHAFVEFAWHGRGTPAPPAPTERLVVRGIYRFVRNPMYVAVDLVVLGQALAFQSWPLAWYLAVIAGSMHLFVVSYEEPTLRQEYGAEHAAYCEGVRRWIPRMTPWSPAEEEVFSA